MVGTGYAAAKTFKLEETRVMAFGKKELGVAVVGAGRMGTHRARLAAQHPAVRFLAISDIEPARANALGARVGAHLTSGKNDEVISHPDVNAVIVRSAMGHAVSHLPENVRRSQGPVEIQYSRNTAHMRFLCSCIVRRRQGIMITGKLVDVSYRVNRRGQYKEEDQAGETWSSSVTSDPG